MTYEETINSILSVLAAIKAGTADNLTATTIRQMYLRDITWLLKQLAERNAKNRGLVRRIQTLEDSFRTGLTTMDEVVQDLKKVMGN